MRIIISGGGTGGHIYPALAIASALKERVPAIDILYVGTKKGLENKIVPQAGLKFKTIDISGIDRSSMLKAGKSLAKFPISLWQARDIIKDFNPDIIVGTGGYVSYPIVLAGTIFGNKTVIHEQNAFPGLANRNLAKRVDYVMVTFPEAEKYLNNANIKVTGLPVRKEITEVDPDEARISLNFAKDIFTLVAFGGSRGAMSINKAMLKVVEKYQAESIQIVWITGEAVFKDIKQDLALRVDKNRMICNLKLLPYMYNIQEALAIADLAVCRSGASTICELEALGLPAILIPYPYATDNHQEKNARALLQKKAVEMVIDEFLDGDTLYNKIEALRNNRRQLQIMKKNLLQEAKPNALKDIVDLILSL